MSSTAKDLFEDALKLPDDQRAALAVWLIESLDEEAEDGAQTAWDSEIFRRITDLDNGTVKPIPWSEARRIVSVDRV